jgi:GTP-binding protein
MTPVSGPPTDAAPSADILEGERLFARNWRFVKSVPALEHLPPADRPEVAFAGRSNVGKSSLLNALMRHKGLARTSNTPGRTQELNYFTASDLDPSFWLVDMPGYGFAKAPKAKVDSWTRLVKDYLRGRVTLTRVFLLIDSRHGIKAIDEQIMKLLDEAAVTYQVVLTKADKIPPHALVKVVQATEKAIARHPAAFPAILPTSSETGLGIAGVRAAIATAIAPHRS